ncbi:hypothetical protein DM860_012063 [Cuscuta australis]|uniref:Uncharacterized protein n=1 Tax=Cuscuta australis TaxID=267555 RepID=A0A328DAS7_9ASTE|nr:hypothetical protein DM860_012063 [Cuscuta australis]
MFYLLPSWFRVFDSWKQPFAKTQGVMVLIWSYVREINFEQNTPATNAWIKLCDIYVRSIS